jgi:hypothetical protein
MSTKQIARPRTAGLVAVGLGLGLMAALPQSAEAQTNARRSAANSTTKTVRIYGNSARMVSMELRNAPIRDAIQQLFLKAGVDYILDPNISGTTTLKVTNVPFETALRLLMDASSVPVYVTRASGVYDIRVNPGYYRNRSTVRTASYVPPAPVTEPVATAPVGAPVVGAAPGVAQGFAPGTGYGAPGGPVVGAPIGGPVLNYDPTAVWGLPVFGGPVFGAPVVGNTGAPIFFPYQNTGFGGGFNTGFNTGFRINSGLGLNGFVFPNGNWFFF